MTRALMWFRADLRVRDNPALHAAAKMADRGVIGVFLLAPDQWREHDWADIKVDFILRTLETLRNDLDDRNIPLLIVEAPRFGDAPDALLEIADQYDCDVLYHNAEYEVNEQERDDDVRKAFERSDRSVRMYHDQCLYRPGSVRTGNDDFYSVFTPFKKKCIKLMKDDGVPEPLGLPKKQDGGIVAASDVPASVDGFDQQRGQPDRWPAGASAAQKRLKAFIRDRVDDYDDQRDIPAVDGTSVLSPYLACGAVSVRQCLEAALEVNQNKLDAGKTGVVGWITELLWRDFYRHFLIGYPRVSMNRPYKLDTENITWKDNDDHFEAWTEGKTGFPIVDAAMRQLRDIGWMHNRLRMITAMFLTKDLFIDWRRGEQWFMRRLIDGDLASNNGGWQWSASTGADAAPYFRIFNPSSQSKKFDPDGEFIRRYVPELEDVPGKKIHDLSDRDDDWFDEVGYPKPIVDHGEAREHAIEAFKSL